MTDAGERAGPAGAAALRLFFAVPASAALRERARGWQAAARAIAPASPGAVSWTRPESMHVTLAFVGQVSAGLLGELERAGAAATRGIAAGTARPVGLTGFPTPERLRVLVVELSSEGLLEALAERLGAELAGLRSEHGAPLFVPEARRFRAHLTLARFRVPAALHGLGLTDDEVSLPIDRVVLFSSTLTAEGADHQPLVELPLTPTLLDQPPAPSGNQQSRL